MTTRFSSPGRGASQHRPSRLRTIVMALGLLGLGACQADERAAPATTVMAATATATTTDRSAAHSISKESPMWITVGERRFAMTLADTEAARAFAARLPLKLAMSDLNGNEKMFDLPMALPAKASRPGTIRSGDLMLYGANTVVLFYLTFDSPYAYTRLGRVDDPTGLAQALGPRGVRVVFSKD